MVCAATKLWKVEDVDFTLHENEFSPFIRLFFNVFFPIFWLIFFLVYSFCVCLFGFFFGFFFASINKVN